MDSLTEWTSSGALLLVKQIAENLGSNSISGVPAPDRPPSLFPSLLAHSSSQPVVLQTGLTTFLR